MEWPLPPPVPLKLPLTSIVVLPVRSRRNTFKADTLLPPGTRSLAVLVKTTKRPSGLRLGATELSLPPAGRGTEGFRAESNCTGTALVGGTNIAMARNPTATTRQRLKAFGAAGIRRKFRFVNLPPSEVLVFMVPGS
jgi:hypothetical protein